jgi:hypothetical protein
MTLVHQRKILIGVLFGDMNLRKCKQRTNEQAVRKNTKKGLEREK